MSTNVQPVIPEEQRPPNALLIAVQLPRQSDGEIASSLSELERLASNIGIRAVQSVVQKRPSASSPTLLGEGKLRELALLTGGPGVVGRGPARRASRVEPGPPDKDDSAADSIDLVIVDLDLTPGQQRNLRQALGIDVLDRTEVILRVFETQARTREAIIQVELARLLYQSPRLRDDPSLAGREGGGGRGERGHTNVELAKQRIRKRVIGLRQELAEVKANAAIRSERRKELLHVALVGYTNAGKSSLMRALTGSDVLVEDRLFATLDTTVRPLLPETAPRVLVSDTVGFIRNLPHQLVASFRSTLEETRDADLLLVVVDAADPDWHDQLRVTRETLEAIGAAKVPSRVLLNKIDLVDGAGREALARALPGALLLSAFELQDIQRLHAAIVTFFDDRLVEGVLLVPHDGGHILNEVHANARIQEEHFTDEGVSLRVRALPEKLEHWKRALSRRGR